MRVEAIAIIGAGELGRRWAYRSLRAGCRTILEDVSLSVLEQGVAAIRAMCAGQPSRDGLDSATRPPCGESTMADKNGGRLATARSVEEAVREADLLLETVADELEMKLELFTIFDKFAKPRAILASTTNTVSITDLAEITFCAERCIGMRLACDGGAERLELLKGRWTSAETVARCREVALRMGLQIRLATDGQAVVTDGIS